MKKLFPNDTPLILLYYDSHLKEVNYVFDTDYVFRFFNQTGSKGKEDLKDTLVELIYKSKSTWKRFKQRALLNNSFRLMLSPEGLPIKKSKRPIKSKRKRREA